MITKQLELHIVNHFDPQRNLILPNASFGIGIKYEADLVVITPSDYAYEVELKVTRADLMADRKKKHGHLCSFFRGLWFAIPDSIRDDKLIPWYAGIKIISPDGSVKTVRKPTVNRQAKKLTTDQKLQVLRLAHMRLWNEKKLNLVLT